MHLQYFSWGGRVHIQVVRGHGLCNIVSPNYWGNNPPRNNTPGSSVVQSTQIFGFFQPVTRFIIKVYGRIVFESNAVINCLGNTDDKSGVTSNSQYYFYLFFYTFRRSLTVLSPAYSIKTNNYLPQTITCAQGDL